MKNTYPKEMASFVAGIIDEYTNEDLAKIVSAEYGRNITEQMIKSYIQNHKLKRIVRKRKKVPNKVFTDEMMDFIKANVDGCPFAELTVKVNAEFGMNLGYNAVKQFCTRNGIRNGIDAHYSKGNIPYNKGRKGVYSAGAEKGWFKKGERSANYMPPGSVVISTDGYFMKKVADPHKWELLSKLLWKEAGNEIPEGHRLIFKDGNPLNCTLDNMMLVSMKHHLQMNKKGLRSINPDVTETRVTLLKLNDAIRGKENGKNSRKENADNI